MSRIRHSVMARIGGILGLRTRANVSVEDPLVRGFRDLFWFDFRNAAMRDADLADVVHRPIGARIVANLDATPAGVLVCDLAP